MHAPAENSASVVITDLEKARGCFDQSGLDVLIFSSPEAVRYLSGIHIPTQRSIRKRQAFLVWITGAEPLFVVAASEEARIAGKSWVSQVVTYREYEEPPMTALVAALRRARLQAATAGIEMDYVPAGTVDPLREALPELRLGDCSGLLRTLRMHKSAAERAHLSRAFSLTEDAILTTFRGIAEGQTAQDIKSSLTANILRNGAANVPFAHVTTGIGTSLRHPLPGPGELRAGDLIKVDAGGSFAEYISNVGRTAVLGKASPEQADVWSRLVDVHRSVISALGPGRSGADVYAAAAEAFAAARLPLCYANNGHGIGLEVHEAPIIGAQEAAVYEEGMVTTVETRVLWEGRLGMQLEELAEITSDGARTFPRAGSLGHLYEI